MIKYEVIKRSKEFRYEDRSEIVTGCTVTDPEPEIVESFDTLIDAMEFYFSPVNDIKTSISIYKSSTGTVYVVVEYVIQENEYDSDGNNITKSKPDPEVFLKAAEYLGLPPKACMVVEDAEAGIEAAKKGGMYAAGIGEAAKSINADESLKTFSELVDIVDK